jgi:putative two-component system hydrogenase maturation factor HypX/HoxX
MRLGLASLRLPADPVRADEEIRLRARAIAADAEDLTRSIEAKRRRRAHDEALKPLAAYREEELARMKRNFYGFDPSYHVARYNFIRRIAKSRTPLTLAVHRSSAFRAPGEPVSSPA